MKTEIERYRSALEELRQGMLSGSWPFKDNARRTPLMIIEEAISTPSPEEGDLRQPSAEESLTLETVVGHVTAASLNARNIGNNMGSHEVYLADLTIKYADAIRAAFAEADKAEASKGAKND